MNTEYASNNLSAVKEAADKTRLGSLRRNCYQLAAASGKSCRYSGQRCMTFLSGQMKDQNGHKVTESLKFVLSIIAVSQSV